MAWHACTTIAAAHISPCINSNGRFKSGKMFIYFRIKAKKQQTNVHFLVVSRNGKCNFYKIGKFTNSIGGGWCDWWSSISMPLQDKKKTRKDAFTLIRSIGFQIVSIRGNTASSVQLSVPLSLSLSCSCYFGVLMEWNFPSIHPSLNGCHWNLFRCRCHCRFRFLFQ